MTTMEEAAAEFIEDDDPFRHNAFTIILEMLKLSLGRHTVLVDEILHSIFFLGAINTPPFFPGDILSHDQHMLDALRHCYPRPFRCCSTELPKRSPFSCVLDMVVLVTGQQNENEIINRLKEFIDKQLHGNQLVSSTICVSQKNTAEDSVRYYGVSMSTTGRNPGRIIVAASCLSSWDSYVTDAVMSYYPSKQRRTYFDGTIRLPEHVRCQAISLRRGTLVAPCKSCANLFGLTTNVQQVWAYGHCAEAESVSNLLRIDEEVREQVEQPSETCTPANRQTAKASVKTELRRCLDEVGFQWNDNFYNPQV